MQAYCQEHAVRLSYVTIVQTYSIRITLLTRRDWAGGGE